MTEPNNVQPSDNIVPMRQATILRVTGKDGGGVSVAVDYDRLYDLDEEDTMVLLGCLRVLESKVLAAYNERTTEDDE